MLIFIVPENNTYNSIKDFLRRCAGLSLTQWRRIKQHGDIFLNNEPASISAEVSTGDVIAINLIPHCTIPPIPYPLKICYEDDYMLVVDKPPGILVHPTAQNEIVTLANAVIFYYQSHNVSYGFHPVHRLDRNTSGLTLIAKEPHIQHLFNRHSIKALDRTYYGIISGAINPPEGTINLPIGRKPDSIIERTVRPDGQNSITMYKLLHTFAGASLVELKLLTGRTHQIRVHMSHIGHPLLGDDLYGGSTELIKRQALHAIKLAFHHPVTKKEIIINSSLPEDLITLIRELNHS